MASNPNNRRDQHPQRRQSREERRQQEFNNADNQRRQQRQAELSARRRIPFGVPSQSDGASDTSSTGSTSTNQSRLNSQVLGVLEPRLRETIVGQDTDSHIRESQERNQDFNQALLETVDASMRRTGRPPRFTEQ
ncbi:13601_t:CDS:2 [Funneliformis mosseae]|uniref:13601_t:CDS:1 n=1 Tax=Funneliformis mosseae TaxID=27381 RepID=A0A9N9C0A0_FUNMO|nr:13601_t:CDS:2 [Funneliformis mosseae]